MIDPSKDPFYDNKEDILTCAIRELEKETVTTSQDH